MITIALAQFDFLVGNVQGNLDTCRALVRRARDEGADLLLFPELALAGYPPEDLLLRPGFLESCEQALDELTASVQGIDVVVGHPGRINGQRFNMASWIRDGQIVGQYAKQLLPNYAVFDEQRYFSSGSEPLVVDLKGHRIGVLICEDTWEPGPALQAREHGAELLLVPNASPYRDDKRSDREAMFSKRFAEHLALADA